MGVRVKRSSAKVQGLGVRVRARALHRSCGILTDLSLALQKTSIKDKHDRMSKIDMQTFLFLNFAM